MHNASLGLAPQSEWSRRRCPRYEVDAPLLITVVRSGVAGTIPGRSKDVGERGLAGIMAGELFPDEPVLVEFSLPSRPDTLRLRAAVRHRDRLRYGFEFTPTSFEDQRTIQRFFSFPEPRPEPEPQLLQPELELEPPPAEPPPASQAPLSPATEISQMPAAVAETAAVVETSAVVETAAAVETPAPAATAAVVEAPAAAETPAPQPGWLEETVVCPNCGNEYPKRNRYCGMCSTPRGGGAPAPSEEADAAPTTVDIAASEPSPAVLEFHHHHHYRNDWLVAVVLVLALVVGWQEWRLRSMTVSRNPQAAPSAAEGQNADAATTSSLPSPAAAAPVERVALTESELQDYLVSDVTPIYPAAAQEARIQGTVVLAVLISTTGEVSQVSVVSGPRPLMQAAVDAVRQWRYRPYQQNGKAVQVASTIAVNFALSGD